MTRPKSLQVHVSFELAERVRSAAERRDISVSEWIRSLLQHACDEDDLKLGLSAWMQRMHRQALFTVVGIDALLSGHSDPDLRDRARGAYARRCAEFGLVQTPIEGGFDEA